MKKHQILQRLKVDFPGLTWEDTSKPLLDGEVLEILEAKTSGSTTLEVFRTVRNSENYSTHCKIHAKNHESILIKVSFKEPNWRRVLLNRAREHSFTEMIKDLS